MQKFEHRLRTTVHTRSVENIMTRSQGTFPRGRQFKLSQPKLDNISTYLRKFQIDRENLNLAKRIMECQSEHSRNKYNKEWKKTKKFLKVRSNFKPQLCADEPKIFKFQEIPGHGRMMIRMLFSQISSHLKQLNYHSLYLLKFVLGGTQLIPNKDFLTLNSSAGYTCSFLAPLFLKNKTITVKLIKVVQNSLFDAGKFIVKLDEIDPQEVQIISKTGKVVGKAIFNVWTEVSQKGQTKQKSQLGQKRLQDQKEKLCQKGLLRENKQNMESRDESLDSETKPEYTLNRAISQS